jgi:hypothetical protein
MKCYSCGKFCIPVVKDTYSITSTCESYEDLVLCEYCIDRERVCIRVPEELCIYLNSLELSITFLPKKYNCS